MRDRPGGGSPGFRWHDLMCADPEGAAGFYAEVFGWEAAGGPGGVQFSAGGVLFASAQPLEPESGWPAHWLPVLGGFPVREAVDRLLSLQDVDGGAGDGAGHLLTEGPGFAVIADPQGAALALADLPSPLDPQGRGPIAWTALLVAALPEAGFWLRLLGLSARGQGSGLLMCRGPIPVAGALPSPLAPPGRWVPCVQVEDPAGALDRVVAAGGRVLAGADAEGGAAICADREGAVFGVLSPSPA